MKLAIVDDLSSDALTLRQMLMEVLHDLQLSAEIKIFSEGEDLLSVYEPGEFSVIFLDILLGKEHLNGLEIARKIRKRSDSQCLVFTTTERAFALEGYSVWAMDYLVKPFTVESVRSVLLRVQKLYALPAYIEVREQRQLRKIPVDTIVYITSVHRVVEVHTQLSTISTYMTLAEIAAQLPDSGKFQSCCRGIIVNFDQVRDIQNSEFILYNGEQLPISRSKRAAMKEAFTDYLFAQARGGDR